MTWNATERPRSGHTVANGPTSTAPSCCGIDEIGDASLLPNDDGDGQALQVLVWGRSSKKPTAPSFKIASGWSKFGVIVFQVDTHRLTQSNF